LRQALEAPDATGKAEGFLTANHHIDSDTAFLPTTSNNLNMKLRAVADHVVQTAHCPNPEPQVSLGDL